MRFSGKTVSSGTTWFDTYHDINGTLNGRMFKRSAVLLYGPTCNLAISQAAAKEITFDECFKNAACEDIDFCFRLLGAGYRLVHRESMLVRHDYQFRAGAFFANVARFIRQFRSTLPQKPTYCEITRTITLTLAKPKRSQTAEGLSQVRRIRNKGSQAGSNFRSRSFTKWPAACGSYSIPARRSWVISEQKPRSAK